ncbi:hypothetical protein EDB85DRAFT_12115 [Lactarius pseudohatsudake]|nr:hypothetical protein EDB85DRAFT_12115 [Lactarius pseudohatsudake]
MPLRPHPKVFQVLVKTHKLTIFLSLPNVTPISTVKEQVLSAFSDDVFKGIRGVPSILDAEDFVLSREVMERGRATASYEVLTDDQLLRDVVGDWVVLFIQFKNESGEIQPVEVTIPSLAEDDDDVSGMTSAGIDLAMDIDETPEESSVRKGKRKAVD